MANKIIGRAALFGLTMLATGCATKSYVNENNSKMQTKFEAKISELEHKLERNRKHFDMCSDGKYDFDTRCINFNDGTLEKMMTGTYPISIIHLFEDKDKKISKKHSASKGTAVMLIEGYMWTSRHLVTRSAKFMTSDEIKDYIKEFKGLKYRFTGIFIGSSKENSEKAGIVYEDFILDSALLKVVDYDKKVLPPLSVAVGKPSELKPGNKVYLFGNDYGTGHLRLRDGIVSKLKDVDPSSFNVSTQLVFGASGGPVFALRDGAPEFVGIMKRQGGDVVRIDYILLNYNTLMNMNAEEEKK